MDIREFLCGELKKYNDVIIYGFKDIGTCVLDYIINLETDIKRSNYSGRVKYFAHTATWEKNCEKKGIPIRGIEQLTEYAEDALVIVATQEQHHQNIKQKLDELGFKNHIYILHEMYIQLKEIVGNYNRAIDNQVRQYSMMHEIKLDRLRRKIAKGKKAKVFFMTQRAAAFGAASVYRAMEKSEFFEPYILCISKRDKWYQDYYNAVLEDVEFFEKRDFRTINAFDSNGIPKDFTVLNPDIIFFDSPNLYGPAYNSSFRLDHINWKFLTCYIPYGLLMVDSFYYHYNNLNVRECWKYFVDTDASHARALMDAEFNGLNIVKAGYPKFDDYEVLKDEVLPAKLQNNKKTVIYAPHWSIDSENNFSTFDIYKDYMLDIVKTHPEINFVFKPHPELGFRIRTCQKVGKIDFTYEDYVNYINEWNSLENGICITQGAYVSIFERSDCLITDCGSFIGEYLPSLNPCIYLFNPRKKHQDDAYTPLAKKILSTYYVTRTKEELIHNIEKIIFEGKDEKREDRIQVRNGEFGKIGHAGQYICNYLEQLIRE